MPDSPISETACMDNTAAGTPVCIVTTPKQQPLRIAVNEEGSTVEALVDPTVVGDYLLALLIICLCSLVAGSSYVRIWGLLLN